MRRVLVVVLLSLVCLVVSPVPANAWVWKWLDDLSGPQFWGFDFELRVVCGAQRAHERSEMLAELQRRLIALDEAYQQRLTEVRPEAQPYFVKASELAKAALKDAELAAAAGQSQQSRKPSDASDSHIMDALKWRRHAMRFAKSGERVQKQSDTQGVLSVEQLQGELKEKVQAFSSVSGSACRFRPLDMNRMWLSVDTSVSWDEKDTVPDIAMITAGGSFHWRAASGVTLGVGAGGARFLLSPGRDFWKPYVQPLILDLKPGSIERDPRFRGWGWHTFSIRYSVTTFPGGFDPGSFGPESPGYPTEFVQSVALHIDVEPLMRKWRGKWW